MIYLFIDIRYAFIFALMILILQQFDGNFLGPKILGDSTGLSSFWVMFAILLAGGLFGLLAGILCDTSSNVLFGFQSILYLLICTAVGLLVVYFMQPSVTNSLIFVGCGFAGRLLLEYFFYYAMWGYDNAYLILLQRMLPNLLYTLALTPLWFLLVRRLHRFFQEKLE